MPFSDGKRYLDYGSRVTAGGRITNTNTLNNNSVVHSTYSNGTNGVALLNGASVLSGTLNKTLGSINEPFRIMGFVATQAGLATTGELYAIAVLPSYSLSMEKRIRHSMAFSYKLTSN